MRPKEHFYSYAVEQKIRPLELCGAFLPTNKKNIEKTTREQTLAKPIKLKKHF